jgi:hypothetical protein
MIFFCRILRAFRRYFCQFTHAIIYGSKKVDWFKLIVVVLLVLTLVKVSGTEKAANKMVSRSMVTELKLAELLEAQNYNLEFDVSRNFEIWTAIDNI